MAKINARSPYYVYSTSANLTQSDMELYIYTGTQTTSRPGTPTYTLSQSTTTDETLFEISELVRDYIEITFNGQYDSQMVWVDYRIKPWTSGVAGAFGSYVQLAAFDGYGTAVDGPQNQSGSINDTLKMFSTNILYKNDDAPLRIPVEASAAYNVTFHYKGEQVYTVAITAATTSSTRIKYIEDSLGVDSYKDRVIADGGTYEWSLALEEFLDGLDVFPVDEVYIDGELIKVYTQDSCDEYPIKLVFVNKYGALQDLWFTRKNVKTLDVQDTKYKASIMTNTGTFDMSSHSEKILTKNGKVSVELNSGFFKEEYNDVFEELLLSEQVWMRDESENTWPVNITSKSMTYKTQLNDKLIEYNITVEHAYDRINNYR